MSAKTDAERAREHYRVAEKFCERLIESEGVKMDRALQVRFINSMVDRLDMVANRYAAAVRAGAAKTTLARMEAALRIALHDVATGGPMDQEGR